MKIRPGFYVRNIMVWYLSMQTKKINKESKINLKTENQECKQLQ